LAVLITDTSKGVSITSQIQQILNLTQLEYYLPNDVACLNDIILYTLILIVLKIEQERLGRFINEGGIRRTNVLIDLQHHLFLLTLDGKLNLAPVCQPQLVLDIGTGTGIWVIDFGKQAADLLHQDAFQRDFVVSNFSCSCTIPICTCYWNRSESNTT
jgi:hypothetical protein